MADDWKCEFAWGGYFEKLNKDLWVTVSGGGLPSKIRLRLGETPDGRMVCTGLVLGYFDRQEITTRSLRKISPPRMMRHISEGLERGGVGGKRSKLAVPFPGESEEKNALFRRVVEGTRRAAIRPATPRPRHPGRKGLPADLLREVAEAYLDARSSPGRFPINVLRAKRPNVPDATLRYWVRQARERGYVEEAKRKRGQRRKR